MRGGFRRYKMYIGPGQESQEGTSEYLIMFVTTLYIKYMLSANWTFCCTGNEAFIKDY